jgi:SMC interacting uncharacterized protein involved in chromosome segregation
MIKDLEFQLSSDQEVHVKSAKCIQVMLGALKYNNELPTFLEAVQSLMNMRESISSITERERQLKIDKNQLMQAQNSSLRKFLDNKLAAYSGWCSAF